MTEPRGRTNWKPNARTLQRVRDIQAVLREYHAYLPVTGRQVYYRLLGQYHYSKGATLADAVSGSLVNMRRTTNPDFHVPFDHIREDRSVSKGGDTDWNPEDFWRGVRSSAEDYSRNHQEGQPRRLEVWCEAAGMVDQLWDAVWERDIRVESGGGKDSLTLKYKRAKRVAEKFAGRFAVLLSANSGQPTMVLYFGDWDTDGREMFDNLREDVPLLCLPGSAHVIFERVALTPEQIEHYQLPEDPDHPDNYQLEALAPDVIRELLLAAVERHWDQAAEDQVIEQETVERTEIMRRVAEALGSDED